MRHQYKNYYFDYALKCSLDIADKYYFLIMKAKYIVQKSTMTTAEADQAKRGKAPRKDTEEEKGNLDSTSTNVEDTFVSSQKVAKKR